jgi:transcriptional regulator with XRE-family HTH domain
MPYDIEDFAKRLRNMREARGMTRSAFARRVSVTPTAVWNWETQYARPKPNALSKIASVLEVSENFLTTGADSNGSNTPEAEAPESLRSIIDDAMRKIATATGMPLSRIRLSVEFLSS